MTAFATTALQLVTDQFEYDRMSKDDRHNTTGGGLGVQRQHEDIEAALLVAGVELESVSRFTDNNVSATKVTPEGDPKPRPDFEKLLAAVAEAGEAGHRVVIWVWSYDRLFRLMDDLSRLIKLSAKYEIELRAVKAPTLNLRKPTDQLIAQVLASIGQYEVQNNAQRSVRSRRQRAESGKRSGGCRTFGFGQTVVGEHGRMSFVDRTEPNAAEAAAINEAFVRKMQGWSDAACWRDWNERGLLTSRGNPWDGAAFKLLMTNPALIGQQRYLGEAVLDAEGKPVQTKWAGIVEGWGELSPQELFEKVGVIMKDPARSSTPGPKPRHMCGGLISCAQCEVPMRSSSGGRPGKRVFVYRCSSCGNTIMRDLVDQKVADGVAEAYISGDAEQLAAAHDQVVDVSSLYAELDEARSDNAWLVEKRKQMDAAVFSRQFAANAKLREELEAKIANAVTRSAHAAMLSENIRAMYAATWMTMIGPNKAKLPDDFMEDGPDPIGDQIKLRAQMRERFLGLPLEQRRDLIKALIRVTVEKRVAGTAGGESRIRVDRVIPGGASPEEPDWATLYDMTVGESDR